MPKHSDAQMKIAFVIRAKMGDTLIAFASVRHYADLYPEDDITLLVRKDYGELLRSEAGIRIVTFGSRIEMMSKLLWMRMKGESFDVLAILWGYGNPIRRIGKLVKARRKISMDGSFPEIFPESPPALGYERLVEQSWLVVRVFRPEFSRPEKLCLSIGAGKGKARNSSSGMIAIVPLSAEARKNLDPKALEMLMRQIGKIHPDRKVWIFVNPSDTGSEAILRLALPAYAEFKYFQSLRELSRAFEQVCNWYGVDTGLCHLAIGMGIPSTIFFGPTQPEKVLMSAQPKVQWVRAQVLGNLHCEEKSCSTPLCLHRAVAGFSGGEPSTTLLDVPAACPLRGFSEMEIRKVTIAPTTRMP
jgi:ADP-heptose:LPS heptosyltransferase